MKIPFDDDEEAKEDATTLLNSCFGQNTTSFLLGLAKLNPIISETKYKNVEARADESRRESKLNFSFRTR